MIKKYVRICALLVCTTVIAPVHSGLTKAEADRLNDDLTPLGAERGGNADGTIPPWTGEYIDIPESYEGPGYFYPDPFPEDEPLFTITADNVDEHADNLTTGLMGMFKTYPETFKMNVYKTRRTATYPEWYYENIYEISQTARLEEGGRGVLDAKAAIPFPIPENGLQAVWNHLLRFRGIYFELEYDQVTPTVSGRYTVDRVKHYDYFPYYDPNWDGHPEMLFMFVASQLAPPRVAGDQFLFHDYVNAARNPRNVWRYFAGQRRVRRAPVFVYDTPIPPSHGYRTIDSFDTFFGVPDKYEWELKGKREIYIPYNNYRIADPSIPVGELVQPGHLDPEPARWELHRVWVVDGTLKDGERHVYSRRTFYIDEDSWQIAMADLYDDRGDLWRVIVNYLTNFYDVPVTYLQVEAHHDLETRRYNALPLMNDDERSYHFSDEPRPRSFFTPDSIRRLGTR